MDNALKLMETCWRLYERTATGEIWSYALLHTLLPVSAPVIAAEDPATVRQHQSCPRKWFL